MNNNILPPLPGSWSALTWQQLCDVWSAKIRYGGNPDVASVAALLTLTLGSRLQVSDFKSDEQTGEHLYLVSSGDGQPETYVTTARELAWMAKQALPWFPYPYGDPGKEAVKDEKGKVVKEAVEPHRGYVNENVTDWYDAMMLPKETVIIDGVTFALPAVACENLTWHQYRVLQSIAPQIFQGDISEDDAIQLQAQFMAYITVPESSAKPSGDLFDKHIDFKYQAERAEASVPFWRRVLEKDSLLFHICFQVWQTATANYYPSVFPLLFDESSQKSDPLHTALTGEVGTINAVMKYQGYASPQEIYDTNLPIILGVLSNMTKEAREYEEMNHRISIRKK